MIRDLGLAAKKSLGQNFILDLNLTRRIARAAGPLQGRSVIEVGPGPGGLTRALFLEGAEHVIAIERDERCRPALEAIAARYPGRLTVEFGDALEADWPRLAAPASRSPPSPPTFPTTSPPLLLIGWLESEPWPPWYDAHGADVPEGGGRAHRRRARQQGLRPPRRPRAVAHASAHRSSR